MYETFDVEEYLIVDPNTNSVDSFFLKDAKFHEQKNFVGAINSKILGTNIVF